MNADGSGQTRLTANAAWDGTPAWSPDGTRIAFASDRDGDSDIYLMNADGTAQTSLIAAAEWGSEIEPAWSPDGSRIAFTSDRDGNAEVYVMNADGTGQTRRTASPGADGAPAWSPDGSRIAFESDRDDNVDIHVMNADGSGRVRLTTDAAYDGTPAWHGAGNQQSPPAVSGVTVPPGPVAVKGPVSATATFTDAGSAKRHTATWAWGDGVTSTGTVAGGSVAGTHAYSSVGVYRVTVTVTDDGGESGTASAPSFVVAYDPNGRFVTGGGWIQSPAGAYLADPALTGPAAFGFTARYSAGSGKKGSATNGLEGKTEFLFRLGDLNFQSTSYERLAVSGHKATIRGTGTINGKGVYGFQLSAIDGQQGGGKKTDRFRIRIWDGASGRTVYDNQARAGDSADPATAISGGAITIARP
jgi:PKD repeat protein